MKKDREKLDSEVFVQLAGYVRVGSNAIRKAEEENRQLGLPNVYSRHKRLIFEMPDGRVVVKDLPEAE